MNQQITGEDARSLLTRAGLNVPDDRLGLLAPGIQIARAAAAALAALELGYGGSASFQAPPPDDTQGNHGD